MSPRVRTWSLLGLFLLLLAIPQLLHLLSDAGLQFVGTDSQATDAIGQLASDYRPWIGNILPVPEGEMEGLLFLLQGGLGTAALFYCLHRSRRSGGNE
ncbi:MAG: cobalt ABC transporter substrate-binding protein CbiN [Desulfuromonas sp.]|nr:MAG: cobalt ABC transporter substrate-binding protein CbiN [Desulfuromonas sp.]